MKKNNKNNLSIEEKMIRYGIKPPQISQIQLQRIKIANEQFGVKTLSAEEVGQFELTPENVKILNKNIHRENQIITGEYKRNRDEIYLKNYMDILSKAGANPEVINKLKNLIPKLKKDTLENVPVSSLLPPLKDFYITLKRGKDNRGRYISISDQIDTLEEQINTAIKDLKDLGYLDED